jgi:hypothetical protein
VITPEAPNAVMLRAGFRCEYCLIEGWELQVDHISPRAPKDATSVTDILVPEEPDHLLNLAAACPHCNRQKRDFVTGSSILFGGIRRLFNPRSDVWQQHFAWSEDYQRILPLSAIGDATIQRLEMNARIFRRQRDLLRRATLAGGFAWP